MENKQKNRLYSLRTERGLSLGKLSSKLKDKGISVSSSQLSYYEKGVRSPRNQDFWNEAADFFGVSTGYLLGYNDVPDKYRGDEILIDNGEGGFTSLSTSRHRELMEEYNERIKKEFINFLRLHDFVLSDNEIQAILEHITKLDVNSGGNIDYKRIITDQAGAPRKYLVENGYKELGDLFQSSKGLEDFYKEKGYDPDYTF